MGILLLKLLLTPLLIGAVSLAGRRWGDGVSGWLAAFPLTSGPVVLFLALDQGTAFATSTATGILAGVLSVICFCLAYSWLAQRWAWPLTALASLFVFLLSTWALQHVPLLLVPLFLGVMVFLVLALRLLPRAVVQPKRTAAPWWDIPARMLIAATFVLTLTSLAPLLGPRLSGLLAPFPIFASILSIFAHHFQGPAAVASLLRGILLGLFAFSAFFLVVAGLLEHVGLGLAFALATCMVLMVQGISLVILRRPRKTGRDYWVPSSGGTSEDR
jgi:hypothetical protein